MVEPRDWLIRKDGYFYRPNCQGYTTHKHEAGRYSKEKAEAEASVEPWHMKAIHESEWPDDAVSSNLKDKDARIAELEAEVGRLTKLYESAVKGRADFRQAYRDARAEALSRTGAAKVRELLDEGLEILNGIIDNVKRRGNYSPESTCVFIDQAERVITYLSALEPAAPEGQQPEAYRVHAPEDEHYGTGPDRLQFHSLAQYDLDNGYRQTPLYTRPSEQAVTEAAPTLHQICCKDNTGDRVTEAMVEAAYEKVRRMPASVDVADGDLDAIIRAALKAAMEAGHD